MLASTAQSSGRRILSSSRHAFRHPRSLVSSKHPILTDSLGIPTQPAWSVHDLLSSYPKPTLSSSTLKRLHELSALIPPEEGTPEHDALKTELEELVRLVEAVRLVDFEAGEEDVPDGRIWAKDVGLQFSALEGEDDGGFNGQKLLQHSARTDGGFYVVDSQRRK